jgi:hypothetical protein
MMLGEKQDSTLRAMVLPERRGATSKNAPPVMAWRRSS